MEERGRELKGHNGDEELGMGDEIAYHTLHAFLPPPSTASQNYSLRQRAQSLQLPERSTHLSDQFLCGYVV